MQAYRPTLGAGMLAAALALAACSAPLDMSTPTQVSPEKIRVRSQMVTQTLDAGKIDTARVRSVADDFERNGKGMISLTVSYLEGERAREAAAEDQGDAYKRAFKKLGVTDVSVVTVPVTDAQYAGQIVIAYRGLVALAPKDCNRITGYQGGDNLATVDNYRFGCETNTALSRMIADPSDLMGHSGVADNDSHRSGAVLEGYKSGTPNTQMKGFSASNIGTQ